MCRNGLLTRCEWLLYRRVSRTQTSSRRPGRRPLRCAHTYRSHWTDHSRQISGPRIASLCSESIRLRSTCISSRSHSCNYSNLFSLYHHLHILCSILYHFWIQNFGVALILIVFFIRPNLLEYKSKDLSNKALTVRILCHLSERRGIWRDRASFWYFLSFVQQNQVVLRQLIYQRTDSDILSLYQVDHQFSLNLYTEEWGPAPPTSTYFLE